MVADLVTAALDFTHDVGVPDGLAADHEERAGHAVSLEHGEDLGCPPGLWAVVEGERDSPAGIGLR